MSQRGSIHRRGDSWTVRWRTETADGRKQHSKGGFRTKKEAQEFLTDTMAAIRGGVFSEPTKVTLGEFLTQRWLPARKLSLRPSTWSSYEVAINRHVLPQLGGVQMQQLSPDRLDRFYADLSAAGLAPKTVRNIHVMIHKALHDAVRKNLVPRNAAEAADPPKLTRSSRSDMSTWTPEQLRDFFAGIAHHRLAAAYLLAATTGMRRGEVLGLRWADVDFIARHLHVRQTILSVNYELTYGRPKTLRGERKIALDTETIRALRAHRVAQQREMDVLGAGYRDQDLVFARENGDAVHPDYFSQTFDRTVKRLGLPKIRLHDLRHTHATLGLKAGVPIKVMSDRLGHATTAFTMDIYTHAIPAIEHEAAEQIADLVFGIGSVEDDDKPEANEPDADDGTESGTGG
jgi:integrase